MRDEAKTWWLFSGPDVALSYFFKRKSVSHLNHEPSFGYRCYRQRLLTICNKVNATQWVCLKMEPLHTENRVARSKNPYLASNFPVIRGCMWLLQCWGTFNFWFKKKNQLCFRARENPGLPKPKCESSYLWQQQYQRMALAPGHWLCPGVGDREWGSWFCNVYFLRWRRMD